MNCAFCQAENGPAANFCSDCGSPLGLQFCPECDTVSEKAAAVCTKCGCALLRTEESAVGENLTPRPPLPPQLVNDHSLTKETGADNWHELLQSLEEEVHNQLALQTRLPADEAAGASTRIAPAVSNPLPRRRIAQVYEAAVIESTPSVWGTPGLWVVLACAVGGCYILLTLPSPEIEQRALISSVGKSASAPAVVSAPAPPLRNETQPILGAPSSSTVSPAPAPSPPDATQNSPPEKQPLPAEAIISAAGNAPFQSAPKGDAQNEPIRAMPATSPRLTSSDSQLLSTASGRLAFANRAAARRTPLSVSHLILTVSPWGEVYVDNKKWGLTPPLAVLALRPGKHSVQIRNANLPPYEETIKLQPDQTLRIKHKFK
jgi:hypothetical protein